MNITTKANNLFPKIEWECGNLLEAIERTAIYCGAGTSSDGKKWEGQIELCCGLYEVKDIIEVKRIAANDDEIFGSWGGFDY